MALSSAEIKRKVFHHLSLLYIAMYAFLPRAVALAIGGTALLVLGACEFLRLRRPELNAWLLKKFGGIHRTQEIMKPSGIFWTLLGCFLTMLVFQDRRLVLSALGMLAFGDAAAALGGQKWGVKTWPNHPTKTYVGSACFAVASILWTLLFLRPHVAVLGALVVAWLESRSLPWNDNLWIPLTSGLVLSVLNLTIGKLL